MHYCALLVTKEIPTDNYIAQVMKKYSWDNVKEDEYGNVIGDMPTFTHDYYIIGGRYAGSIKLKIDETDEEYRWGYMAKEPRNHRLFISGILDTLKENIQPAFMYSEEKYFSYMGSSDNILYADGIVRQMKKIKAYNYMENMPFTDKEYAIFVKAIAACMEIVKNELLS